MSYILYYYHSVLHLVGATTPLEYGDETNTKRGSKLDHLRSLHERMPPRPLLERKVPTPTSSPKHQAETFDPNTRALKECTTEC